MTSLLGAADLDATTAPSPGLSSTRIALPSIADLGNITLDSVPESSPRSMLADQDLIFDTFVDIGAFTASAVHASDTDEFFRAPSSSSWSGARA